MTAPRDRIALFTAISDGYDTLKSPPAAWQEGADCIAYTSAQAGPGWHCRPLQSVSPDPARNAKTHKIFPRELFESYSCSIWIDGSVIPKASATPKQLIDQTLADTDLAVFKHRVRRCIYEEAEACIAQRKDDPAVINSQMQRYRAAHYPPWNGLCECTVLVRRHTPEVVALCREWMTEIERGSKRDQLSFNYVAHSLGFRYALIPGTILRNDYFTWYYHDGLGQSLRPVV